MLGKGTSEIGSIHCIIEAILCSGSNDVNRINKEVPNIPNEQILLNWSVQASPMCMF
jgi:hypothetical protein